MGISRVALWKRIELLRAWGYGIASSHDGYTLVHDDGLAAADLKVPGKLQLFAELPSTMDAAHKLAASGAASGSLVMSLRQTAGRNRDGKEWPSPQGGLYASLICRADLPLWHADGLVLEAARIILDLLNQTVPAGNTGAYSFVWPNSILHGRRKVAGLLLEQHGGLSIPDWYVLGLGVDAKLFSDPAAANHEALSSDQATSAGGRESSPRIRRAALGCSLAQGVETWLRGGLAATATSSDRKTENRWRQLVNLHQALDIHLWNGERLHGLPHNYTNEGKLTLADGRIIQMAECRTQGAHYEPPHT
ncbi:MAG: biotin--[acetyl-CoA-carboxylase] ligase [Spirochaetes bacterium]|nr:biotin--[acetyl-CoA-carboxylase] ligase [Spirochaetota bacterium]